MSSKPGATGFERGNRNDQAVAARIIHQKSRTPFFESTAPGSVGLTGENFETRLVIVVVEISFCFHFLKLSWCVVLNFLIQEALRVQSLILSEYFLKEFEPSAVWFVMVEGRMKSVLKSGNGLLALPDPVS
jgi:hypothetical protein